MRESLIFILGALFGLPIGAYISLTILKLGVSRVHRMYKQHLMDMHETTDDPNRADTLAMQHRAFEAFEAWVKNLNR